MYMKLLTVSKKWALACLLCIFSVYNTYAQYTEAALVGAITANTILLVMNCHVPIRCNRLLWDKTL